MFKMCEIRLFLYVARKQIQQYTLKFLQLNCVSPVFLLHDLDLHFRFQMLKICEIRSFAYVAGC